MARYSRIRTPISGLHVVPLVLVEASPQPERRDPEREAEAQQVQQGPCLEPGERHDGRAQHRVEAEHQKVVVRARVRQHRGEEPADDAEHRQGWAVLDHRQGPGPHRHHDHRHRGGSDGEDVVDREGGEGREIQHGHTAALEADSIDRVLAAQPPADGQQRQPEQRHRDQAHLERYVDDASPAGLPQQQPHADQRHQHPHLDRGVAGGDPVLGRADEPGDRGERLPRGRAPAGHGRRGFFSCGFFWCGFFSCGFFSCGFFWCGFFWCGFGRCGFGGCGFGGCGFFWCGFCECGFGGCGFGGCGFGGCGFGRLLGLQEAGHGRAICGCGFLRRRTSRTGRPGRRIGRSERLGCIDARLRSCSRLRSCAGVRGGAF